MIVFREIGDDNPALAYSPMVRAIEKTFGYIAEHGPIGLTAFKAFKLHFVVSPSLTKLTVVACGYAFGALEEGRISER